jgi:hypothetical protein
LYSAVIERRVGARTWLAFNVVAAYESYDRQLVPFSPGGKLERETIGVYYSSTSLRLGLRHVFVHKLVDVSFTGALVASRRSTWRDDLRAGENISGGESTPTRIYALGVQAGMTLERELIEALALRLTLGAASLDFSSTESFIAYPSGVATPIATQGWRAEVSLQTGLQLHFYF